MGYLMKNGEKGFTLIELLVVMAIIATLMTLVAPRFFKQTEYAKQVVLEHNLNAFHSALDAFRRDRFVGPQSLDELVQEGYLRQLPVDPFTGHRDSWQLILDDDGQIIEITSPSMGTGGKQRDD